jgi:signal transduction histidine kinase
MAGWSTTGIHVPTATRLPLEGDAINALVWKTGAPGRVDSYDGASGELAALLRQRGVASEVGAPVVVDGRLWGALIAGTDKPQPLAAGAELRVASFAELVATAIANATKYSELVTSRARIVTAADEARRRIERDLHDGTQQRLVSFGLELQLLQAQIGAEDSRAQAELERLQADLDAIIDDVREISRGLHPSLLAHAGLAAALSALARRAPVPVELQIDVEGKLSDAIEVTAYYVVSEALTNAAKHAEASGVSVDVTTNGGRLLVRVRDDGVGGAVAGAGSGLVGLEDRVEALGGRFDVESPREGGTTIVAELPLASS